MKRSTFVLAGLVVLVGVSEVQPSVTAFYDDFDGGQTLLPGVTGGFSGVTSTESVQGYVGLGTGSNAFTGDFLRNGTVPPVETTLALTGLPAHISIDLNFLLAVIDSWDGDTTVGGLVPPDYFNVKIIEDGGVIFHETFDFQVEGDQSYLPPPGVQLTAFPLPYLGFNGGWPDAAYDMGLDPAFDDIPHTSSTLTIEFFASGSGWQGGLDESWAIENVEVIANPIPEPASIIVWSLVPALAITAGWWRRRRRAA